MIAPEAAPESPKAQPSVIKPVPNHRKRKTAIAASLLLGACLLAVALGLALSPSCGLRGSHETTTQPQESPEVGSGSHEVSADETTIPEPTNELVPDEADETEEEEEATLNDNPPKPQQEEPTWLGREWTELVGQSAEKAAAQILQETDHQVTVQIVRQGSIVTLDYNEYRVRIVVDENQIVVEPPRAG